jgi:hypothetical protein
LDPVTVTANGITLEERLSSRHLPPGLQTEFIPNHVYSARHNFGHALPTNDLNLLYAYTRVPVYSRTSEEYGRHYRHHNHQNFLRGANFRLPLPPGVSNTDADRFRAHTSLMFQ